MKRLFSVIVCLGILLSMIPFSANAQTTKAEEMDRLCRTIYRKTLYNTGRSSLNGVCGLMAGYQLWLLDVTTTPEVYDGNDYYDIYAKKQYSSGGNKVRILSAENYTLSEALHKATNGGTRDVYNLVACFQWTNTQAGRKFGHVVVIPAILDGMVYFTESFRTSLGGAAGNTIVCSIDAFEAFYEDWTRYEGLIVLGKQEYAEICTAYPADLLVRASEVPVLSQPCSVGSNDCREIRKTESGEVLHTTGLLENESGELYYRIEEGDTEAYIPTTGVTLCQVNTQGVTLQSQVIPPQEKESWQLQGQILSAGSIIHSVRAQIIDADGQILHNVKWQVGGRQYDLTRLNDLLTQVCVPGEEYGLKVYGLMENATPYNDQIYMHRQEVCLWQTHLQMTEEVLICSTDDTVQQELEDGWYWDGSTRYYYQNGAPRTGWFCDNGADYYLQKNGAVTTGWAQINGYYRYFTELGVMRTGWVESDQGIYYMRSNGVPTTGLQEIDGALYCFSESGILFTNCVVRINDIAYSVDSTGVLSPTE